MQTNINRMLNSAITELNDFKKSSLSSRMHILKRVGYYLKKNKTKCANLISIQSGKLIQDSQQEVEQCILLLQNSYAKSAKYISDPALVSKPLTTWNNLNDIQVVLTRVNYPFYQIVSDLIYGIQTPKATIYIYNDKTQMCLVKLQKIFVFFGLPKALFCVFKSDFQNCLTLLKDTRITQINFLGHYKQAQLLNTIGNYHAKKSNINAIKPQVAFIACDANLSNALDQLLSYRMICGAELWLKAQLIYLPRKLLEQTRCYVKDFLSKITTGSCLVRTTKCVSTKNQQEIQQITSLIEQAILQGAYLEQGLMDNKTDSKGYLRPVVLSGVSPEMEIFYTQVKAPVIFLRVYDSLTQIIPELDCESVGRDISVFSQGQGEFITCFFKTINFQQIYLNHLGISSVENSQSKIESQEYLNFNTSLDGLRQRIL
ncbi:aldehyde dehydrogenase family protein [Myroides sp. LJL110]